MSYKSVKDKIWSRAHKAEDLDLAIKITTIEGKPFVNLRDYVPSTKEFGKGVLFPIHLVSEVRESLEQIEEHYGVGKGAPSPEQEALL